MPGLPLSIVLCRLAICPASSRWHEHGRATRRELRASKTPTEQRCEEDRQDAATLIVEDLPLLATWLSARSGYRYINQFRGCGHSPVVSHDCSELSVKQLRGGQVNGVETA